VSDFVRRTSARRRTGEGLRCLDTMVNTFRYSPSGFPDWPGLMVAPAMAFAGVHNARGPVRELLIVDGFWLVAMMTASKPWMVSRFQATDGCPPMRVFPRVRWTTGT